MWVAEVTDSLVTRLVSKGLLKDGVISSLGTRSERVT